MWISPFLTASQNAKKPSHRYGYGEKVLANEPLKDLTMERVRVEEFEESLCKYCGRVNLVLLGFLSQNSLWKFSTFCGYKRYLYWSEKWMRRVSFSITEWTGDLASQLDWVASPSREITEWLDWTLFPVVLQLVWRFSFSACFTHVHLLAACKPRATREI